MSTCKITPETIRAMKGRERIASLTAYDYPTTKQLDAAGIPLLLVGDSLGMVVLGYENTTHVTMAEIEHHLRAVVRAKPQALIVADLPYQSYTTVEAAVTNAKKLMALGAEAVKAEGGLNILPQVKAILAAGIPFLGHLGMSPQNVVAEGGYHVKGKQETERESLLADARALADAGAFAIVLELVAKTVAGEITRAIKIPTIGIASGPDCDGEILVTTDLLGTSPNYIPKHVKKNWGMGEQIRQAALEWKTSLQR